jgi:hypothetical protein
MISLYPAQLRALAAMCEALNDVNEMAVSFGRISVRDEHGSPLGYLVDETGGGFVWAPPEWFPDTNPNRAATSLPPSQS